MHSRSVAYFDSFFRKLGLIIIFLPIIIYSQSKLCTGILGDPIISTDFGSGNALYNTSAQASYGFSTTFSAWNRPATNDGYYSIVNRIPNDFRIQNVNVWLEGEDHTPGDVNGYMMLVNADATRGEFYRDTVENLCLGGTYEFSSYLANIFKTPNSFPNPLNSISPKVRFEIRDLLGNVLDSISTGNITNTNTLNWQKYGLTFTAPATSIVLVMISTAAPGIGNDIVLDDIAFRPCTPATISISPTISVCEGGGGTFTVRVEGNADYKFSRWQISRDDGTTWTYVGDVIVESGNVLNYTVDLSITNAVVLDDQTRYRLILSTSQSNLSDLDSRCNVISPVSLLIVNPNPVLEITDPEAVCGLMVDLTAPAVTVGSTLESGVLSYYRSLNDASSGVNEMTTTQARSVAVSGQYYIRVATPTNPVCSDVHTVNVVIEPVKTLTLTAPDVLCKNNAVFTVNSNSANIENLSWTNSTIAGIGPVLQTGPNTSLQVVPTSVELARDSMWITVSSIDATVCPNVKDSVRILFASEPQVGLPSDTSICHNGNDQSFSIYLSIQNAENMIHGVRYGALSVLDSATLRYSYKPVPNALLTDSISIVATRSPCPSSSDYMLIRYTPKPLLQVADDIVSCTDSNVIILNASSSHASTYLWSVSDANTGVFSNTNSLGTVYTHTDTKHGDTLAFYIEATSNFCGSIIDTLRYVYERPVTVSASNTVSCIDDLSTEVTGVVSDLFGHTFLGVWSTTGSGTFGSSVGVSNVRYLPSDGDKTSTYVDLTFASNTQKICPNLDTTFRYVIHPLPIGDLGPDTSFCLGLEFERTINSVHPFKYKWGIMVNNTLTDSISGTNQIRFTPSADTRVLVTISNPIGCTVTDELAITVIDPPAIIMPEHLCLEDNVIIDPIVNQQVSVSGSFNWFKEQALISSSAVISPLNISDEGVYIFEYRNQDCISKDSTLVTRVPNIELKDQKVCFGSTVTLTTTAIADAKYYWNSGSAVVSNTLDLVVTTAQNVSLKVEDKLGCIDSISAVVTGVPVPDFGLKAVNACEGENGSIEAELLDPNVEHETAFAYQWSVDEKDIDASSWKHINFSKSGNYSLTTKIGNCIVTKKIQALIYPLPLIRTNDHYKYCNEDPDPLVLKGSDTLKHSWYQGVELLATTRDLLVHPEVPTLYRLELENENGCKVAKPIQVDICCAPRLFLPNVITPHTKDINSYLNVFGANYQNFDLTVFNRWGEIIYNTNDADATWDGNYLNQEMPIGVYPWIVTYDAVCPDYRGNYKLKGDVTILR